MFSMSSLKYLVFNYTFFMSSTSSNYTESSSDNSDLKPVQTPKPICSAGSQKGKTDMLSISKIDPQLIGYLEFKIPPDVVICATNWREYKLPEVPLPNDNEIEEEIAQRFNLSTLYRQILTA